MRAVVVWTCYYSYMKVYTGKNSMEWTDGSLRHGCDHRHIYMSYVYMSMGVTLTRIKDQVSSSSSRKPRSSSSPDVALIRASVTYCQG